MSSPLTSSATSARDRARSLAESPVTRSFRRLMGGMALREGAEVAQRAEDCRALGGGAAPS